MIPDYLNEDHLKKASIFIQTGSTETVHSFDGAVGSKMM